MLAFVIKRFILQVFNQPALHTDTANNLLDDLNDPSSQFLTLVAAGDTQAVLGFTYAKVSLINIPPNLVRFSCHL